MAARCWASWPAKPVMKFSILQDDMLVRRQGNTYGNLVVCILHPSSKSSSSHHNPLSISVDDSIALHMQETSSHIVNLAM